MKLWISVASSALVLALAALAGYLYVENANLRQALAESQAAVDSAELEAQIPGPSDASVASSDGAQTVQAIRLNESTAALNGGDPAQMSEEERQQARRERIREMMMQRMRMFEDPERRVDLIEGRMGAIDRRYSPFFRMLDLSDEEFIALKSIMAEMDVSRMESRIRSRMADTDEKREALRQSLDAQQEYLEGEIAAMLGDEQAEELDRYNDTLPYRDGVNRFSESLSYTDAPLSGEQSEALIKALASVGEEYKFSVDFSDRRVYRSQNLSQQDVDTYAKERETYDDLALSQASEVLNEQQLQAFAEQQISQRERDMRQIQSFIDNAGARGGPQSSYLRGF